MNSSSGSSYTRCTWRREGDNGAQLEIYLSKYDNSRTANRLMQQGRSSAEEDGDTVTELQVGDDAFGHPFDSYISSADTRGVAVEIRIDNLILEVEQQQISAQGGPDKSAVGALATELAREIASQKPSR